MIGAVKSVSLSISCLIVKISKDFSKKTVRFHNKRLEKRVSNKGLRKKEI